MSSGLTALTERVIWIGAATASVVGAIALLRLAVSQFTDRRSADSFLPAGSSRSGSRTAMACRGLEVLIVLSIGLALIGTSVLDVWWHGVDLEFVPAERLQQEFRVIGMLGLAMAFAAATAIWRPSVAIVTTAVLFTAHASLLDRGTIFRGVASEADLGLGVIEIQMADDSHDTDVWVNGEYLGQTPLSVKLSDWKKLPQWLDAPTKGPAKQNVAVSLRETIAEAKKTSKKRPRWFPCLIRPDRSRIKGDVPEGMYYLWVEVAGEPIVEASASGTNIQFDGVQWLTTPISISGQSRAWQQELDRLFDQARARDYRIESPAEWLAALRSFGEAAWVTGRQASAEEPPLRDWLEQLLRVESNLPQQPSAADAWAGFLRLEQEATAAREYRSDSRIGWCLDLLLPHLDPVQLAQHAVQLIDDMRWCPVAASWHEVPQLKWLPLSDVAKSGDSRNSDSIGPHRQFELWHEIADVTHFRRRDQLARLSFVAHAVWLMDARLDLQSEQAADNPIEQAVVPALLRRSWQFPEVTRWAKPLGGSLEDRNYAKRFRDWQRRRPDLDLRSHPQVWQMAQADMSEAARRWRREHADEVLELADRISLDDQRFPLGHFQFILSDADGTEECLAARYWPRYRDRMLATDWKPNEKLAALWQYLVRLEPLPTATMYADAIRLSEADRIVSDELNLYSVERIKEAPRAKRDAIMTAIKTELESRMKAAIESKADRRVAQLKESLRQLPQLKSRYFATYAENELARYRHSSDQADTFTTLVSLFTLPNPICVDLRDLLASPDVIQRSLGLRIIESHPAPHIRPLLANVLNDADESIRTQAKQTVTHWNELATDSPTRFQREATR